MTPLRALPTCGTSLSAGYDATRVTVCARHKTHGADTTRLAAMCTRILAFESVRISVVPWHDPHC